MGRDRNHPKIVPRQSPSDSKQKAEGCLKSPPARWRSSRPWTLSLGHTVSELSSLISQRNNGLLWESRDSHRSYWLTADSYLGEKGKGSDEMVSWDALQKRLRKIRKYSFARSHPHCCLFTLYPHCCLFTLKPHCLFILYPHCCLFTLYPHCCLFTLKPHCLFILYPHCCLFTLYPHCHLFTLYPHYRLLTLYPHCCLFTLYPSCHEQ